MLDLLVSISMLTHVVQVSNWFANARRRLKNTVRQPDLSWALRIKLYNQYIQGNAEKLSVCSDDTNSEGKSINCLQFTPCAGYPLPSGIQMSIPSSNQPL